MDLLQHYKDFLINVFIVFLPLVFFKYTIKFQENKLLRIFIMYILFVVPMILTMNFPIKTDTTIYDLRAVPLTVGSLYGGIYTSILLFISLIAYRLSLGGLNLVHYIAALLPTFILLCFVLRKFNALNIRNKILTAIGISILLRTTVLSIYLYLGGKSISFEEIFIFSLPVIITQSLITGFYIYLIEAIRINFQLRDEVIKTEKIRIVSDIAASVAHEVRNPLTSVRGFIQLLGRDDLSDEKRKYYSNICLEELNRAQQIISDYLSLAKPELETLDQFDIKNELEYITNILGSYANYQNVRIINHCSESQEIAGDKSKFRQAIINFGKNAIEAMPNEGVLEFATEKINNHLELLIVDNGMGMSSEQVNRLGTPFYSTKEKGTGLGTMISYNIIKKMSGKIKVTSKPGKGTTYKITFPLLNEQFDPGE